MKVDHRIWKKRGEKARLEQYSNQLNSHPINALNPATSKLPHQNHLLPRVYPFQSFEKYPPGACCSFQLALRPAIAGSVLSRFWLCKFEKRPAPVDEALERRRSLTLGKGGEPEEFALLAVFEDVEASEPCTYHVSQCQVRLVGCKVKLANVPICGCSGEASYYLRSSSSAPAMMPSQSISWLVCRVGFRMNSTFRAFRLAIISGVSAHAARLVGPLAPPAVQALTCS